MEKEKQEKVRDIDVRITLLIIIQADNTRFKISHPYLFDVHYHSVYCCLLSLKGPIHAHRRAFQCRKAPGKGQPVCKGGD